MLSAWTRPAVAAGMLAWTAAGCGQETERDCLMPPCPLPMAVILTVTSAAGGPVANLSLTVSGRASGSGPCSTGESASSCMVPGTAGTYNVRLTAPGFEERSISVTVEGSSPPCECPSVQTQRMSVVLSPG